MKTNSWLIVAIIVSLLIGGVVSFFLSQKQISPKEVALPANAQKIVDCFPSTGALYSLNWPAGPTYLLDPANKKVIGVVYMTETKEQVETVLKDKFIPLKNVGLDIEHVDVKFWSNGHGGYEQPHFDVYFYSVPHEVHDAIKC